MRLLSPASVLRDIVLVSYVAFGFYPYPASAQTDPPSPRVDSLAAAADRGDADAQYEYGRLFEVGANGIAIDYQTPTLLRRYESDFVDRVDAIRTLRKVMLMTPENIHLNAFMYEPILDMSADSLKALYSEVSEL